MSRLQLIAGLFIGAFVLWHASRLVSDRIQQRGLARRLGCKACKTYPHSDWRLGVGLLYNNIRHYQSRTLLEQWAEIFQSVGKTFDFWIAGQRLYMTNDPENMKAMLSTFFDNFDHGPKFQIGLQRVIGDGIFAVDGEKWHAARALLRPAFARDENEPQLLERHFQSLLKVLPTDDTAVVDLSELFEYWAVDTSTEKLFGESMSMLGGSDSREVHQFDRDTETVLAAMFRDLNLGFLRHLWPNSSTVQAIRRIHQFVDKYIQRALEKHTENASTSSTDKGDNVFLKNLIERTNNPIVIRDQTLSAFFGGRDTTSKLLSNMMYICARAPDVWDKLRMEALELAGQPLDQDTMKKAKYMANCLNECKPRPHSPPSTPFVSNHSTILALRLYPVVPLNIRTCNKNSVLPRGGGADESAPLLIPKGSSIYMSMYHMHLDPDIWGDDVLRFNPERWENLQPGAKFMPFSMGPRVCIGRKSKFFIK